MPGNNSSDEARTTLLTKFLLYTGNSSLDYTTRTGLLNEFTVSSDNMFEPAWDLITESLSLVRVKASDGNSYIVKINGKIYPGLFNGLLILTKK